jgi:hypothetical protein
LNIRKFQNFFVFLAGLLIFSLPATAQHKKHGQAHRINAPVLIDGHLNEKEWSLNSSITDFYQFQPYVAGEKARYKTTVTFLYDSQALYVGAMHYDPYPDSILKELSVRDDIRNTDFCGVYLDPYNDAKNAFGFFLTASGVQVDMKSTENGGEDATWDAVWESAVAIVDSGWVAEMRIPYSALRIPAVSEQVWGMQYFRHHQRYRETYVWNPMDPEMSGLNNQGGILEGIRDIDPALRLSLSPYASIYFDHSSETQSWKTNYKAGMDLKYGINESFTLDMILIPDFGQVQSDDQIVNLSAYEQQYSEKRPFFTEGMELFSKGDIFYSRRIGSEPLLYWQVEDSLSSHERIIDNPENPQLINATKISGKTSGGLGVGVINAMTAHTFATIEDTLSGASRKVETNPFTNYNMMVVDKVLGDNSYVSLANTNVYRGDNYYMANVSALDFKLTNRSNMYAINGVGALSQKYQPFTANEFGYKYYLEAAKVSGNFTWSVHQNVESNTYDPNDMGFLMSNNDFVNQITLHYNQYEPTKHYLNWYNEARFTLKHKQNTKSFEAFELFLHSYMTLKNHSSWGGFVWSRPIKGYDYDEPRNAGWKYEMSPFTQMGLFVSPDYRKTFVVDISGEYGWGTWHDSKNYEVAVSPRFRFNDKFTLRHQLMCEFGINHFGYVADDGAEVPEIIFGRRNTSNIVNTMNASYIFNNESALSFRMRHYWLQVDYRDYYTLLQDGRLSSSDYENNEDFSTTIFNIDMSYSWRFAPGSEMSVVWKNAIFNSEAEKTTGFFEGINNSFSSPATNSLSVRVLYYIDYQQLFKNQQAG